jgi:chemotaxis family two-component system response regulator Rcp1
MSARREVLLVEDDPDDVLLVQEALLGCAGLIDLKTVGDGLHAADYLRGRGAYAAAAKPALMLLDWRLPGKSGLELLREIRADRRLKGLPVLVLTTSASARDVEDAYRAGANCFLTKPVGLDEMTELFRSLESFWLVHCRLPMTE